jgi:histidinol-phosphatase (PHP family)
VTTFALPADDHVHTQWSWDTATGDMAATCARAIALGLPSVAFTEHADFASLTIPADADLPAHWAAYRHGSTLVPPPLDVDGYLASVAECRERFPGLRIRTGVELSEPHLHCGDASALLATATFERRLASVHSTVLPGGGWSDIGVAMALGEPRAVVRDYLREVTALAAGFDDFTVLAHIDYPIRHWPAAAGAYDPADFEDEHREALRALVHHGKVLEVNTRVPLHPVVLRWWREEGGDAITFASDAHQPDALAAGFTEAAAVARAAGFRGGNDPADLWRRD